jgi:hypothetical protein
MSSTRFSISSEILHIDGGQRPLMTISIVQSKQPWPAVWRSILSGPCASLVGLGLARFAYTPLLSAIISAHWFAASDVARVASTTDRIRHLP